VGGASGAQVLAALAPQLAGTAREVADGLRSGSLDGHLEASSAVALTSVLRYAAGWSPLDAYELEHGKVGTPAVVVEDLVGALSRAIEELTRPVDAIKHQAKTVTVGISRSDEALLGNRLVQAVLAAGAARDRLSYRTLRTLAELDPAVDAVLGSTRYVVEGDPADAGATVAVVDRAGISLSIPSRVERVPLLRGTKRRVAIEREVLVATGRNDGRTILLVPEVKGSQTVGLTLLHLRCVPRLAPAVARGVLQGYRDRYARLRDLVTETEPTFREDLLADVDVLELLTGELPALSDRWRGTGA
jgi:glucosamine--fructose-6-phosphate aminotransferase (isomerizing)